MTHHVELREGLLFFERRLVVFEASPCRPARILPGAVECFGAIGNFTDVEYSRSFGELLPALWRSRLAGYRAGEVRP